MGRREAGGSVIPGLQPTYHLRLTVIRVVAGENTDSISTKTRLFGLSSRAAGKGRADRA